MWKKDLHILFNCQDAMLYVQRAAWTGSIVVPHSQKNSEGEFKLGLEEMDGGGLLERNGKDITWKFS